MHFNTAMPKALHPFYNDEICNYKVALLSGDYTKSWLYLERAHIIGQAYPFAHTYVHWLMLKFGFRIKSAKEIIGQIPRLLVGGVKSFVGTIPVGNTGGANVPPLKPMEIPKDLQEILQLVK
jgi:hypothetical protein